MHKITTQVPAGGIHRSNMAPFIAVAKIDAVARLVRKAEAGTEQAAINECLVTEARNMARQGRSLDAFRHLARAAVPAGSIKACCLLHSARSGCSTHGYPRSI